jgi:hypothetical protein
MIWIISGPTTSGKSTFIMSARCAELTGLAPGTPVVWPYTASDLDALASTDVLFHFNIMRSRELNRLKPRGSPSATGNSGHDELRGFKFDRYGGWSRVAKSSLPKKAVVLVASKQTLSQRMAQVRIKERPERRGETRNYSHQKWLSLLESVDLAALYRDWLQELRDNSIPYVLVDSNKDSFPIIEDENVLEDIVNSRTTSNSNLGHSQASATRDD